MLILIRACNWKPYHTRQRRSKGGVSVLDGSLFLRYCNHQSFGEWPPREVGLIKMLSVREYE